MDTFLVSGQSARRDAIFCDADAVATNTLLLIANATGVSVLVREHGEVHTPPSAAVGILSALFHATTKGDATVLDDNKVLHALQSEHRSITYRMTQQELLLVFVSDAPRAHITSTLTTKMLSTIEACLRMLVGNDTLQAVDASKQRLALSRHADTIDYIVKNYRKDIRLLLGRPLCHLLSECVQPQEPTSKLQQGVWLQNGIITAEYAYSNGNVAHLAPIEMVALTILSECRLSRGVCSAQDALRVHPIPEGDGTPGKFLIECMETTGAHCIGLSRNEITEQELNEEKQRLRRSPHSAKRQDVPPRLSNMPPALTKRLPSTFACGYASRVDQVASPSCRTLGFLSPERETHWREAITESESADTQEKDSAVEEDFLWESLCVFVAMRLDSNTLNAGSARPASDYKHGDEVWDQLNQL